MEVDPERVEEPSQEEEEKLAIIDQSFEQLINKEGGYDLKLFRRDVIKEVDGIQHDISKILKDFKPAPVVTGILLLITVSIEISYSFRLDLALLNVISLVKLAFVYVLIANYYMYIQLDGEFEIMKVDLQSYIAILTAFEFIIFTVLPTSYNNNLKLYLIFSALSILLALIFQGIIDKIHEYNDNLDSLDEFKVRLRRIESLDKIENLLVKYSTVLSLKVKNLRDYKVSLVKYTLAFAFLVVVAVVASYYLSLYYPD